MSDRLQEIQAELQTILDERLASLKRTIEASEETTRRIVSAEIELARLESASDMSAEAERLETEVAQVRGQVEGLRERRDSLKGELDERLGEGEALRAEVGSLKEKVSQAEQENAEMGEQVQALRTKLANLEQSMRQLKQMMSSLEGMTGGGE